MAHFLIVSGMFYQELAEELKNGACGELLAADHSYDLVDAPGALEIPQLIAYGIASGKYDGCIALGTVIRGDTGHYDIVAGESSRALMDLSLQHHMPIGNGILTVENFEQAWERASILKKNKGADAARAALHLVTMKLKLMEK